MAGRVVEVDGGDNQVGNGNEISRFSEEGQKGYEIISVIVGLVVEDYAWLVWWLVGGRHGSCGAVHGDHGVKTDKFRIAGYFSTAETHLNLSTEREFTTNSIQFKNRPLPSLSHLYPTLIAFLAKQSVI